MAGSQSDITLRKTYEISLLNAAYEDRLTGVNNRAYFNQLVETRGDVHTIEGTAILLLNVDQFRRLNDSLGTGAGDALLVAMARCPGSAATSSPSGCTRCRTTTPP